MIIKILALASVWLGLAVASPAADEASMKRFFYSGDGVIRLSGAKTGEAFHGRYRDADGRYREEAYQAISAVFGAPYRNPRRMLSLRLVEFLDYLEDRLRPGALLTITSGYRYPEYNTSLRARGALAAKASLHQYGMAADFIMDGVPSEHIWETVRSLGFGGSGFYHGRTVHVDVGPARFWDEKSSGVDSGLSDDNKLIGVVTDYDVYRPGDMVAMTFIRMTAFPIKVQSQFRLEPVDDPGKALPALPFAINHERLNGVACGEFTDIDQMGSLWWRLPSDTQPGRYLIRAGFCDRLWEQMPESVATPQFDIRLP